MLTRHVNNFGKPDGNAAALLVANGRAKQASLAARMAAPLVPHLLSYYAEQLPAQLGAG